MDTGVLAAINRASFVINGFRNRDLRESLFGSDEEVAIAERSRGSMQTTRWLQLLRAHGIVKKVEGSHRYSMTAVGRKQAAALHAARAANIKKLSEAV